LNQGMGAFGFTPRSGHKYELKIDSPSGIEGKYSLPELKEDGVVLHIPKGMSSAGEPIHVVVQSAGKDRSLLIGAYCRGRLMDHQTITAKAGAPTEVELKPEQGAGGVYRVTVFEQQSGDGNRPNLVPKAERLIYRAPAEQLVLTAK